MGSGSQGLGKNFDQVLDRLLHRLDKRFSKLQQIPIVVVNSEFVHAVVKLLQGVGNLYLIFYFVPKELHIVGVEIK